MTRQTTQINPRSTQKRRPQDRLWFQFVVWKKRLRNLCWCKIHPSWFTYAFLIGIIIGIIISFTFQQIICVHWSWLLCLILILAITLIAHRRLLIFCAVFAGLIAGNFRVVEELHSQQIFQGLIGQTVQLTAKISEDPNYENGKYTLRLSDTRINDVRPDSEALLVGTLYVQLNSTAELKRSDFVTIEGKLGAGFGTFVASMYRPNLLAIDRTNPGDLLAELKSSFTTVITTYLPDPAAGLGLGYVIGQKSSLSEQLAETLQLVGMTHVVVASGAHLGILVSNARKIFGKISKFAGTLVALLLVLFFASIVGFTPSMTRAALVTGLSLLAGYVGRKFSPLRLIILVAAITLLISPTNYLNLGWQLSFASFFGILLVAPRLQSILYGGKHPPWLASMLLTSLATSLSCAPILIFNFGSLSLLSFLANLIILPTLPYAMLLVFLTGITSFFQPLATMVGQLATLLLNLHIMIVEFLSEKRMFILELPSNDPCFFVGYLAIFLLLAWPAFRNVFRLLKKKRHFSNSKNIV